MTARRWPTWAFRRAQRQGRQRSLYLPTAVTSPDLEVLACEAAGITAICPKPLASAAETNGRWGK